MKNRSAEFWQSRTNAALSWVQRSLAATGRQGSAHHFSPIFGWAKAYPETTGYLIETLFDFARLQNRPDLAVDALDCATWLVSIQLPSGAFAGGLVGGRQPSVFNTAMIVFGLRRAILELKKDDWASLDIHFFPKNELAAHLEISFEKARIWLTDMLEPDGSWQKAAFVPGHSPSYYARVVWASLLSLPSKEGGLCEEQNEVIGRGQTSLAYYATHFQANHALKHCGFRPREAAFTHTIAYALEGFLESALLLGDKTVLEKTIVAGDILLSKRLKNGRLAGRYDQHWQGDFSFRCLTGEAQLSVFYHRLWQVSGALKFRQAALDLLLQVLDCQKISQNPNQHGGLPGSTPFWGPYMRFRYPNWAAKFLLDALAAHRSAFFEEVALPELCVD